MELYLFLCVSYYLIDYVMECFQDSNGHSLVICTIWVLTNFLLVDMSDFQHVTITEILMRNLVADRLFWFYYKDKKHSIQS